MTGGRKTLRHGRTQNPEVIESEPTQWDERREPSTDATFTIKTKTDVVRRFKALCQVNPRLRMTHGDLLETMVEEFEKKGSLL